MTKHVLSWEIGGLEVTYDPTTGAVRVAGKVLAKAEQLQLMALLRRLYSDHSLMLQFREEREATSRLDMSALRELRRKERMGAQ